MTSFVPREIKVDSVTAQGLVREVLYAALHQSSSKRAPKCIRLDCVMCLRNVMAVPIYVCDVFCTAGDKGGQRYRTRTGLIGAVRFSPSIRSKTDAEMLRGRICDVSTKCDGRTDFRV